MGSYITAPTYHTTEEATEVRDIFHASCSTPEKILNRTIKIFLSLTIHESGGDAYTIK
ncbi:MAG: hypothetical protein AB2L14_15565 [Candidatus Xenobiia bacterium LiM19]